MIGRKSLVYLGSRFFIKVIAKNYWFICPKYVFLIDMYKIEAFVRYDWKKSLSSFRFKNFSKLATNID